MLDPKTIYIKTAKGQEEIDKRTHKLPLKLRSLLIMINGKVSAGELIEYGGSFGGGMDVLLGQLAEGEFIEPQQMASVSAPASASPAAPLSYDEKLALQAAKNAIKKLVYDQLGPDADMVVGKLEKCESRLQLVAYCDTCKDIVEAALGKSRGQVLWSKAKESIEAAFAVSGGVPAASSRPAPSQVPAMAASKPVVPAPASPSPPAAVSPKREVDQWLFEKVRGEISRLVFDTLGPDGEMMAVKIEKAGSMGELKSLMDKIHEVVRGVRGKQKAEETRGRIEGLIAAVEN